MRATRILMRLASPRAIRIVSAGLTVAAASTALMETRKAPESSAFAYKIKPVKMPQGYYQDVYNAVADALEELDYDDGSYGPVLIRLAWHAAGTYDKATHTGGSSGGATMRFDAEANHGANAGLKVARDLLDKVKVRFPEISFADLWSLAGVVAVQEMGGPTIQWRPGRVDATAPTACTPDGRLPDAAKGEDHIRAVFYRMGFNDQEIVALLGAHAFGRCHKDRSGYEGPWTRAPTTFSNDYFVRLLNETWTPRKWSGPLQYADASGDLMMLPADLALIQDPKFRRYVELYAKDADRFREDFAKVFQKLEELGCESVLGSDRPMTFNRRA